MEWNGNGLVTRSAVVARALLALSKLQYHLNSATVLHKGRQTRFIVSHQRLRPAASTVIIVFRAMTRIVLMAVAP